MAACLFITTKNTIMARKRKKSSHRRRRRVGAMALNASSPLVKIGSIVAGYFLGDTINGLLNNLVPASMKTATNANKTGKMVAIGEGGIGAALILIKGKKTVLKVAFGGVMLGAGIKRFMNLSKAGVDPASLGGYGDVPVIGAYATNGQLGYRRRIAGYGDMPVIGSYTPNSSLNGTSKVMGGTSHSGSTLVG